MKALIAACVLVTLSLPEAWAVNEKIKGGGKIKGGAYIGKFIAAPTPTPTHTPTPGPTPTFTPTPASGTTQRVHPERHFTYDGACKPPTGTHGTASFEAAGGFLAHCEACGAGGVDSLYITSNVIVSDVAEIIPCTPTIQSSFTALNAWTVEQNFADITGGRANGTYTGTQQAGIMPLGGVLWGMLVDAYGQSTAGTGMFQSSLTIATGFQNGVWDLDDDELNKNRYTKYIFPFSSGWATNFGNREFGIGRQANANGANCGPSLYAVNDPGTPPADGANLDAQVILHYPCSNRMVGFQESDSYGDCTWVKAGDYEAFVCAGSKSATDQKYYGDPGHHGCGGTGYHGEPYYSRLLFFDPDDLLDAYNTTINTYDPAPYSEYVPEARLYRTQADYCNTNAYEPDFSGIAYNEGDGYLWVAEMRITSSPPRGPILHRWSVATTPTGSVDSDNPGTVSSLVATPGNQSCALSWSAATDATTSVQLYRVYRDKVDDPKCPGYNQCPRWDETTSIRGVGRSEGTSFTDSTNLTNGTLYTYYVEAIDLVGHVGSRVSVTCTPAA